MVYSFYFLLVGSRRNECNSLWEELRGRGQKSTATQKVCLPAFLLALTLYLQWSILFIFCVLAPEGMNSIVLSGEKGEKSGVCYYSGSMPVRHFYLLALILYLQWSILFIFCVLAPEGMNSIVLGGIKGTDQKVVAYSDTVSVMLSK